MAQKNPFLEKTLEDHEELIRIYRSSGSSQIRFLFIFFTFLLGTFFLLFPLFRYGLWGILGFCCLLFITLLYGLRRLYIWKASILVVTDRRILDIHQKGFVHRVVTECSYDVIEDIQFSQKGLLQVFAKTGTIEIQTQGKASNIELISVKNPEKVHKFLRKMKENREEESEVLTLSEALTQLENIRFRLGEEKFEKLLKLVK